MSRIRFIAILALFTSALGGLPLDATEPGANGIHVRAQGQGINNSPLADCLPTVVITDASWVDKKNGNDIIRVRWQTFSQSACQNFSAKQPQLTGGLSSAIGGASPGFSAGYNVKVNVIRFFGGEDAGSGSVSGGLLGTFTTDVQVPRNHLGEPVSCKVQIRGSGSGFGSKQARITGTGVPSIQSGTQTSGPSPGSENFRPECLPNITITGLTFTPGSVGQKDSVAVSWTATQPVSPCLRILNFGVVVRLRRSLGAESVGSSAVDSNANAVTVQLGGGKGELNHFEVIVNVLLFSSLINLSADKTINL